MLPLSSSRSISIPRPHALLHKVSRVGNGRQHASGRSAGDRGEDRVVGEALNIQVAGATPEQHASEPLPPRGAAGPGSPTAPANALGRARRPYTPGRALGRGRRRAAALSVL